MVGSLLQAAAQLASGSVFDDFNAAGSMEPFVPAPPNGSNNEDQEKCKGKGKGKKKAEERPSCDAVRNVYHVSLEKTTCGHA